MLYFFIIIFSFFLVDLPDQIGLTCSIESRLQFFLSTCGVNQIPIHGLCMWNQLPLSINCGNNHGLNVNIVSPDVVFRIEKGASNIPPIPFDGEFRVELEMNKFDHNVDLNQDFKVLSVFVRPLIEKIINSPGFELDILNFKENDSTVTIKVTFTLLHVATARDIMVVNEALHVWETSSIDHYSHDSHTVIMRRLVNEESGQAILNSMFGNKTEKFKPAVSEVSFQYVICAASVIVGIAMGSLIVYKKYQKRTTVPDWM